MQEEVYNFIETEAKNHWWYKGRKIIFEKILKDYLKDFLRSEKLYEIGCASGENFEVWSKFSDFCVGIDISQKALESAKKFGYIKLILADAENLSAIPAESASVVAACDVLEHTDNDKKGLEEFSRILKKDGILFLTVPAFKFLWGGADEMSLHKRRYGKKELRGLLKNAGFTIRRITYFNTLLFSPILMSRLLERLFKINPNVEYKPLPGFLNYIFFKIFSFEAYLLKFFNFPFGISLMAIAKKQN